MPSTVRGEREMTQCLLPRRSKFNQKTKLWLHIYDRLEEINVKP